MIEQKKVILTGIKPTGEPHLGNYFGAIKPALELAESQDYRAQYFIADYHALNSLKDCDLMRKHTLSVAATWLACGLDPRQVLFYKQSDIPEIFELAFFLMAFTSKGLMNRAHAYKACVDTNLNSKISVDHGINMGLFTYPILMAADILLFDVDLVPVGRDQRQHLDMSIDIAQAINHFYEREIFKIPKIYEQIENDVIVGLDGRKMSKTYKNTISIFADFSKIEKLVKGIVTNSQTMEERKDPDQCIIFKLYQLFATTEEREKLVDYYRSGGMGWGYAKSELIKMIDRHLQPLRESYYGFLSKPNYINDILYEGCKKISYYAKEKMYFVRSVAGFSSILS